jgi:hypothetical protein
LRIACFVPILDYLPFIGVFLVLAGGITGIVLFVKNKKLPLKKSMGLGFLISIGFIAVLAVIVTGLINFISWYDTTKTNSRIYGNVYEWVNAPPNTKSDIFFITTDDAMKGKTLEPLNGLILNFQTSTNFDDKKPIVKLISSADGTFDSGNVSLPGRSFLSNLTVEKAGYQSISISVRDAIINGKIIVIMVK